MAARGMRSLLHRLGGETVLPQMLHLLPGRRLRQPVLWPQQLQRPLRLPKALRTFIIFSTRRRGPRRYVISAGTSRCLPSITALSIHDNFLIRERSLTEPTVKYEYSDSTANGNLRAHLLRAHNEEYLRVSKEKGWVVPSAPSEAGVPGSGVFRAKFTQQAFVEHLVNFIIADNQVCF